MKPGLAARKTRRRYSRAAVACILIASAAAAAWLAFSRLGGHRFATGAGVAESMAGALHSLQQEDAGWNVDVLSAGLGLDESYDEVAGRKRRIDADLADLAAKVGRDADARGRLEMLRRVFDEKADAVETFKSHFSILRNSLRYVSTAADEAKTLVDADTRVDPKLRDALHVALDGASSQALRYAVVGDEDQRSRLAATAQSLDEAVSRVPETSAAKAQLLIVLSHLQTVLHQKRDVDALLRAIVAAPTRKVLEGMQAAAPR
jgi:hypothetical protein